MERREPRLPLSAITMALIAAGIGEEDRERVTKELQRRAPRRGRKEEPDSALLKSVLELADEEKGVSINMAAETVALAAVVAGEIKKTQKEAVRKRLARKAKKLTQQTREQIEEATRKAMVTLREEKKELELLRAKERLRRLVDKKP